METWLRINEGLWISASIVAAQEIYQTPSPAYVDSPEHPVPIFQGIGIPVREFPPRKETRFFLVLCRFWTEPTFVPDPA